ncbi:hypothetical protein FACS1894199_13490 [Bacteroidia bacterium]|nr:hypothetical protein FACS1894199_13490 [Bacteroidia bacterium]
MCAQSYRAGRQSTLEFLNLSIDARASAMGDMGVATSADIYSQQYNPAKYISMPSKGGVAAAYSPWLQNLVKDMNVIGLTGFYKLTEDQAISGSFRYFSMGNMIFRDEQGQDMGRDKPYQFALDMAYSRRLAQYLSAFVTVRYAFSDLYSAASGYKVGQGVAVDFGAYYQRPIYVAGMDADLAFGASLANLGAKIDYGMTDEYFLPIEFRLGSSLNTYLSDEHRVLVGLEFIRPLAPEKESDRKKTSIGGMVASITDEGFSSFVYAAGAEYSLANLLFARLGYFYQKKADIGTQEESSYSRQYLSFGLGIGYEPLHLDFSYVVPTGTKGTSMANTIKVSVGLTF